MSNYSPQHPAPLKVLLKELLARLRHNYNGYSYKTKILLKELYTILKQKLINYWYNFINGKTK